MNFSILILFGLFILINGQRRFGTGSYGINKFGPNSFGGNYGKGGVTTINKGNCNSNCKSYNCNCPTKKEEPILCKTIKVQNKWVVDAANCVSYCVHLSSENNGGYCKQDTCFCSKVEKPIVVQPPSLCETIKVNGKWVVDDSNCVSKCLHSSSENAGGYCKQNNCFCQKKEITSNFCESVYINGKWITDESTCSAHCVRTSHENIGGYCQSDICYCKQAEKQKSLCETVNINGKWITDASGCSSYCVHLSHENSGGYCKQDSCFCNQVVKNIQKPLCQQVKVNYKWVTDSSGCTTHCYQMYKGMKKIGYCQNNNCYCK